jgi:hypothetical protein
MPKSQLREIWQMGHSIYAIVAPLSTANAISHSWPELPRLNRENGFAIFPVDATSIDARVAPEEPQPDMGNQFMLLTNGFRSFLAMLSRGGALAYVETEYFGGTGGQGALVCRDGEEVMPPTWHESGTINAALKLIGLSRGLLMDRFAAIGFARVRSNDDLLAQIEEQSSS